MGQWARLNPADRYWVPGMDWVQDMEPTVFSYALSPTNYITVASKPGHAISVSGRKHRGQVGKAPRLE